MGKPGFGVFLAPTGWACYAHPIPSPRACAGRAHQRAWWGVLYGPVDDEGELGGVPAPGISCRRLDETLPPSPSKTAQFLVSPSVGARARPSARMSAQRGRRGRAKTARRPDAGARARAPQYAHHVGGAGSNPSARPHSTPYARARFSRAPNLAHAKRGRAPWLHVKQGRQRFVHSPPGARR
jgi:hypothetical protein